MLGVITAVNAERDAVLAKMQDVTSCTIYGVEFYEGLIRDIRCIVAMSGVGKVNAARSTQLMIDKFAPDRMVNLGSAGALHPDLRIGDVVISTACIQHDVDLTLFGASKGFFSETEGFVQAEPEFMSLCQQAMEQAVDPNFRVLTGPIATGDQFNSCQILKEELYREFGAYCIEMEGAAVAQVCSKCQIPFVIIRSISDSPSEDTLQLYEKYKKTASQRCADFLVQLIKIMQPAEV